MKYTNVSYGCQMNVHESEKIAGILEELGYTPAGSIEESDIIVFNTCCIRDTAEKRAFGNIGAVKPIKKKNKDLIVAVVGCMTEQKGYDKIFKEKYPYVDIVLGTGNLNLLKEKIIEKREQGKKTYLTQSCNDPIDETVPQSRTSYPNAWVNIMYGCNNFCTYCIVPYVRGRERSREPEEILKEVRSLVEDGYKEITLLGQNVNSYGNDFSDRPEVNFANLLKAVSEIPGKFRIRFMTSHPKDLTEEVVDVIASSDKIMNNIHLPVQAGSDAVLKKMNRKYDRAHYLALIDMIKAKLPGVGITTDIMVGFPTETMSPSKAIAHRSAYSAQNSTSCDTIKIVTPASVSFLNIPASVILKNGSSPFVGSSRSRMSGFRSRIFASAARCCSPPERS